MLCEARKNPLHHGQYNRPELRRFGDYKHRTPNAEKRRESPVNAEKRRRLKLSLWTVSAFKGGQSRTLVSLWTVSALGRTLVSLWTSVKALEQARSIVFNSPVRAVAWGSGRTISVGLGNGQVWDISSTVATGSIPEEPSRKVPGPVHTIALDLAMEVIFCGTRVNWSRATLQTMPPSISNFTRLGDNVMWLGYEPASRPTITASPMMKYFKTKYGLGRRTEVPERYGESGITILGLTVKIFSSAISFSPAHLLVKTMFDGLFWVDTNTVRGGRHTGQILLFKIHKNKPTFMLDLHGATPQALASKGSLLVAGVSGKTGSGGTLYVWGEGDTTSAWSTVESLTTEDKRCIL
ncbi:hypothetical protein GGX14DRAFT_408328 [Mycena pura]|uniref:Uncharacterized protein n=1 Tax=Mycena pura TaxID=153505 RepID=A0AAD6UTL2_9AGAR|nr:hypothetical protein GGX14DRAFT_408328 [Mycena pura]